MLVEMLVALPLALTAQDVILIRLHGPDGQEIYVNPKTVVSVRPPRGTDTVGPQLHCLLHTTDGKYIAVTETCDKFVAEAKDTIPFPNNPP
jgi:hypothetical protein